MFPLTNEDCKPGAEEMAQKVKSLASKYKAISSMPGTHIGEEIMNPTDCLLIYTYAVACAYTHSVKRDKKYKSLI